MIYLYFNSASLCFPQRLQRLDGQQPKINDSNVFFVLMVKCLQASVIEAVVLRSGRCGLLEVAFKRFWCTL